MDALPVLGLWVPPYYNCNPYMTSFFHRIAHVYLIICLFIYLKQYLFRGAKFSETGLNGSVMEKKREKKDNNNNTKDNNR